MDTGFRPSLKFVFLLMAVLFLQTSADAQFYNGLQMDFGKNRVQYHDFYWSYYRYDRFDVYFDYGGKELSEFVARTALKKINEVENTLDYSLEQRVIFIIYNKHSDFKQSNFGLVTQTDQSNIGGVTKILNNKVLLYNEGDHKKLEQQISASLAEVMINEMLYGGNFKDRVANSTLINLPEWFTKGLYSYISRGWDFEIENKVKDGMMNNRYKKFNRLTGEDAVYAGHSIWNYIANTFGKNVIPNIIYLTRVNKNPESAFLFVLGSNLKELTPDWLDYYKTRYKREDTLGNFTKAKPLVKRPNKNAVYQQVKISPDGKKIAYTTNEHGQYKVWIYDTLTHKHKRILKREHALDQVTDYSYPLLCWHPTGKFLTIITEERGEIVMRYYYPATKKFDQRSLFEYEKILDFSYSNDGFKIVLSAINNGQTDICVYNLTSNKNEYITHDFADDLHPRFINNSQQIIFSSNRKSDTLRTQTSQIEELSPTYNIFVYDYKHKSKILTRISDTPYENASEAFLLKKNTYSYLTDYNGVINRRIARYDSTISFIDTTTHFRFFTHNVPQTNYRRNIIENDINPKTMTFAEIIFNNGKYNLYYNDLDIKTDSLSKKIKLTDFRKRLTQTSRKTDSLNAIKKVPPKILKPPVKIEKTKLDSLPKINPDSAEIDINNYVFEIEKHGKPSQLKNFEDSIKRIAQNDQFVLPKQRIYEKTFYKAFTVSQLDFSFLNTSYQTYTGGEYYFNPGGNVLFKVGVNDLFEDYRVIGGVRFAGNFDSNEYMVSVENLKYQLDKQFIFHRQVLTNSDGTYDYKVTSNELMYILKYPFDQVTCLKGTLDYRNDRQAPLAVDNTSINLPITYTNWVSAKLEYIFDNTLNPALNYYYGTRYKAWIEAYKQIGGSFPDLYVWGVDVRHYQQLHRGFIWASRFAMSNSFGSARLIYYLGGTDNWMNLSSTPTFDNSVGITNSNNYAFQAVATNMRGFTQNIRNGNWFALTNQELRFPVFRYFFNRPISNDFINNFSVIGFFDAGTAWTGSSPQSTENAYNSTIIQNNPITVVIDNQRSPLVYGYGWGLRSRLFGYFIRADWARGVDSGVVLPQIFYLSLSLDF